VPHKRRASATGTTAEQPPLKAANRGSFPVYDTREVAANEAPLAMESADDFVMDIDSLELKVPHSKLRIVYTFNENGYSSKLVEKPKTDM
jgi:hypothetical protein